jgi:hypothetical protein
MLEWFDDMWKGEEEKKKRFSKVVMVDGFSTNGFGDRWYQYQT